MVDKSRKYWYGDCADDIDEFLKEYIEIPDIDIKSVICRSCGSEALLLRIDSNEGAIQVKCPKCGEKKILLDCEEIWEDANPRLRKCAVCKMSKEHNVKVGFIRRENGDAKWVYIGSRCTGCGVLASYLDWRIDYGPTDEMEKNI
ncbi:MAG: hypothetical protein E7584_01070 [Ruminococcaceae bacterium]|nr:hypothetical protein [Oscillospiraceae bacterium]